MSCGYRNCCSIVRSSFRPKEKPNRIPRYVGSSIFRLSLASLPRQKKLLQTPGDDVQTGRPGDRTFLQRGSPTPTSLASVARTLFSYVVCGLSCGCASGVISPGGNASASDLISWCHFPMRQRERSALRLSFNSFSPGRPSGTAEPCQAVPSQCLQGFGGFFEAYRYGFESVASVTNTRTWNSPPTPQSTPRAFARSDRDPKAGINPASDFNRTERKKLAVKSLRPAPLFWIVRQVLIT
jgi:hypothetical protein